MRDSVLPVMGVLTVVAGAVGLQLGESAIAQIDPTYFQGAAVPARDITKTPRPQPQAGFAQASGWAEGYAARAEDCGDCPALLTRRTHAPVYAAPAYVDATIAPRWERAAASVTFAARPEEAVTPVEPRRIERYLHYPVTAEQAEAAALRPEPELEPVASEGPAGL